VPTANDVVCSIASHLLLLLHLGVTHRHMFLRGGPVANTPDCALPQGLPNLFTHPSHSPSATPEVEEEELQLVSRRLVSSILQPMPLPKKSNVHSSQFSPLV